MILTLDARKEQCIASLKGTKFSEGIVRDSPATKRQISNLENINIPRLRLWNGEEMQKKRGRPKRWQLTDDGRYKCTDCEKTYSSHKGALKHWNKHHKEQSSQVTLFPVSEGNICSKKKCGEFKFGEFHLCEKHLTLHEDRARESLGKNYVVNKEGCWIYKGSTNQIGYAVSHSYNLDSRDPATIVGAYKLSLYLSIRDDPTHDLHNIPLSEYGDVHHRCKVRNCINPEHLIEMSEELHTVLHNLHIKRIAQSVLHELIENYPHLKSDINSLIKNLNSKD